MPDDKQLEKKQIIDSQRLANAFSAEKKSEEKPVEMDDIVEKVDKKSGKKDGAPKSKKSLVFMILGILGFLGGIGCILAIFLIPKESLPDISFPQIPSTVETEEKIYSDLTGMELANVAQKTAPVYCMQIPNGTDGARPHSGLVDAGIVFEAIAEAGITRFAALFQNPTQAVIGPIRSLRMYFLEWDTPFDCILVRAGGAPDAHEAASSGRYKDLQENYSYMFRGNRSSRLWNNLFTTSAYLNQVAADRGWGTSNVKPISRMTPAESARSRANNTAKEKLNIVAAATSNTSELVPQATHIVFDYAGSPVFDVVYDYDATTNTYRRSFGSGSAHESYVCPTENLGEKNPEDVCTLQQLTPSVVVAMKVVETRAADNYHESITTIGSGDAYIFQNGTAIKGTWHKANINEQITFTDENGTEVKLAPGQTFISAVPNYGSVAY